MLFTQMFDFGGKNYSLLNDLTYCTLDKEIKEFNQAIYGETIE